MSELLATYGVTMATKLVERRLARRLSTLRKAAGKAPADVETAQICSRRTINRIERAETLPAWPIVQALAELYGASRAQVSALVTMARTAHDQRAHSEKFEGLISDFALLPELEEDAAEIMVYETEIWPGAIQPDAYARAVLVSNILGSPDHLDGALRLRSARRRVILARGASRPVRALVTEGALRRPIGGGETYEQSVVELRGHLTDCPALTMRVVPERVGAYASMCGSFELLTFADPLDPAVVYTETLARAEYAEDAGTVQRYRRVFDAAWQDAIDVMEWEW